MIPLIIVGGHYAAVVSQSPAVSSQMQFTYRITTLNRSKYESKIKSS